MLHGRLRAYRSHATNEREITYGICGAGEYVGEMGLDGGYVVDNGDDVLRLLKALPPRW